MENNIIVPYVVTYSSEHLHRFRNEDDEEDEENNEANTQKEINDILKSTQISDEDDINLDPKGDDDVVVLSPVKMEIQNMGAPPDGELHPNIGSSDGNFDVEVRSSVGSLHPSNPKLNLLDGKLHPSDGQLRSSDDTPNGKLPPRPFSSLRPSASPKDLETMGTLSNDSDRKHKHIGNNDIGTNSKNSAINGTSILSVSSPSIPSSATSIPSIAPTPIPAKKSLSSAFRTKKRGVSFQLTPTPMNGSRTLNHDNSISNKHKDFASLKFKDTPSTSSVPLILNNEKVSDIIMQPSSTSKNRKESVSVQLDNALSSSSPPFYSILNRNKVKDLMQPSDSLTTSDITLQHPGRIRFIPREPNLSINSDICSFSVTDTQTSPSSRSPPARQPCPSPPTTVHHTHVDSSADPIDETKPITTEHSNLKRSLSTFTVSSLSPNSSVEILPIEKSLKNRNLSNNEYRDINISNISNKKQKCLTNNHHNNSIEFLSSGSLYSYKYIKSLNIFYSMYYIIYKFLYVLQLVYYCCGPH